MTYTLKLHNTLTRKKDNFVPLNPDHVTLYACGPTVYSYAHIGNARQAVVFDTLRRVLDTLYPRVTYVANITDIDDKIMEAAATENVLIAQITKKYADIYNADMGALGVQTPTFQPRATDHVDDMITMIESLITNGHAYEAEGHVLFHVPSYDDYGALSGRNRDEQIAGARVDVAPYKRDPADFVLWKPSTEDQPGWDSPWGKGRPGWHIECSAMSKHFFGDVFDIHGGGLDLTFPHHENEIAQSCCASGHDEFARYWVHNGFLTVEGEKMSKSLGNVLLVHDMIADGVRGEVIRATLLSSQYRQPMNWTQDCFNQMDKALDKFYQAIADTPQEDKIPDAFMEAMCDDMNTPLAFSLLHDYAKNNSSVLKACGAVLGVLQDDPAAWLASKTADIDTAKVEALIAQRNAARADKDYAESDRIRDELSTMGVTIKDGPDGTTWCVH